MSLDALKTIDIIELMENFIDKIRPDEDMRNQRDISYKIEGQSILIIEIRPFFKDPNQKIESPIAKTTFIKAKNHWKVFWMRGNLKWYSYEPKPIVRTLKEFTELVKKDEYHCFWG